MQRQGSADAFLGNPDLSLSYYFLNSVPGGSVRGWERTEANFIGISCKHIIQSPAAANILPKFNILRCNRRTHMVMVVVVVVVCVCVMAVMSG